MTHDWLQIKSVPSLCLISFQDRGARMAFHFASENDHVVATDLSTFGLNVQAIWAESVQQYKAQMVRCLDTMHCKAVESGSVAAAADLFSDHRICTVGSTGLRMPVHHKNAWNLMSIRHTVTICCHMELF
jgi:hypothetical protein